MLRRETIVYIITAFLAALVVILIITGYAHAHMHDRADLNAWFDQLFSSKGLCCSFADGKTVKDVDWTVQGEGQTCEAATNDADNKLEGHYCVRLDNRWILVPDKAVVDAPNRYGPAIVWPVYSSPKGGAIELLQIRCFLRGAEG